MNKKIKYERIDEIKKIIELSHKSEFTNHRGYFFLNYYHKPKLTFEEIIRNLEILTKKMLKEKNVFKKYELKMKIEIMNNMIDEEEYYDKKK